MRKYNSYTVEDLAQHDAFIQWVISPNAESDEFWNNWQNEVDERKDIVQKAKKIVLTLHLVEKRTIDEISIKRPFSEIVENRKRKVKHLNWSGLRIAAAFLILLGLGTLLFWTLNNHSDTHVHQEFTTLVYENTTFSEKTINLADGSLVKLMPGTVFRIDQAFDVHNRRTFLEKGDAYFKIMKKATMPFTIEKDGCITEVIGTAFWIRNREDGKISEIDVDEGKVAVYFDVNEDKFFGGTPIQITPNHKAIIDLENNKIQSRIRKGAFIVNPDWSQETFVFKNQSISKILNTISKAYGVKIKYNDGELNNCLLTTTLTNITLEENLDIVCTALNLKYSFYNQYVEINGKCK